MTSLVDIRELLLSEKTKVLHCNFTLTNCPRRNEGLGDQLMPYSELEAEYFNFYGEDGNPNMWCDKMSVVWPSLQWLSAQRNYIAQMTKYERQLLVSHIAEDADDDISTLIRLVHNAPVVEKEFYVWSGFSVETSLDGFRDADDDEFEQRLCNGYILPAGNIYPSSLRASVALGFAGCDCLSKSEERGIVLKILIPQGTHCLALGSVEIGNSRYADEAEILLEAPQQINVNDMRRRHFKVFAHYDKQYEEWEALMANVI